MRLSTYLEISKQVFSKRMEGYAIKVIQFSNQSGKKSASPDRHRITSQHLDDFYCRTSCALKLRSLAERRVRGEVMSHPYVKEMSAGEKQLFPGILSSSADPGTVSVTWQRSVVVKRKMQKKDRLDKAHERRNT